MSKNRGGLDTIIGLAAVGTSITGVTSLIAAIFPSSAIDECLFRHLHIVSPDTSPALP